MDFYYIINMCEMLIFFLWCDCEAIIMLKQVLTNKFNGLIYHVHIRLPIVYKFHDLLKWNFKKKMFCKK